MKFHLAQINIAKARAPIDSEIMRPFVDALDEINALADSSPGFVWRLKTESGNATSVVAFDDPRIIVNMSVWTDASSLRNYVYRTMHRNVFARRNDWFEKMDVPHLALWWISVGTTPSVEEARLRLKSIREHGETPFAFTFKKLFDPAVDISNVAGSDPA